MTVVQNDVKRHFLMHKSEYEQAANEIIFGGNYILGESVNSFEKEFAAFENRKYCISCANGFDALFLAFNALGIKSGDEVIMAANAYIACANAVVRCGGMPVFCECGENFLIDAAQIESKITDKTKAILAVHLYGGVCDMEKINAAAKKHNLYVVEDCAQSHGGTFAGRICGSESDIACFSFYPTKNMGCLGDGGCIVTNDEKIAQNIEKMRNYGKNENGEFIKIGVNSRLDEIQAAFLKIRLKYLSETNFARKEIAEFYLQNIKNKKIKLPKNKEGYVWHQFAVMCDERDRLKDYLLKQGIQTIVHYDTPIYLTKAYEFLNIKKGAFPYAEKCCAEELSLPIFEGMTCDEARKVARAINEFE